MVKRPAVVFDNNAYRDLTSGLHLAQVDAVVDALSARQIQHDHLPVASPIVAMELVARVGDPNPNAIGAGLRALVALVRHCQDGSVPTKPIRMLMDPEATMCLALFGRLPDGARENLDRLTWLLRRIDETRTPNLGDDERALISLITTHVAQTEAGFVSDTFDTLVRPFDKDVQSWTDLERHPELSPLVLKYLDSPAALDNFARMQVAKAAAALGIQPSSSQMEERTQWLAPYLRTPVRLYNEVVKRVIVDGARLTTHNRANWFWDTHILFGIGPDQTAGGRPVLLVTSDSDMVDAAATSDAAELVLPYDAYVNRL